MEFQPEWKGRVNQKDQDGCTVLHVVAAYSPGYLIKREWRRHSGGCALGWRTPGAGEPTQQAITFYLCRPVTGSGSKLPGVNRGGEGRLGAERGWAREGRVAGSVCSVGFTWLLWGRVTPGHGLPVAFVPALITWSLIAVFYAKSVLQQR